MRGRVCNQRLLWPLQGWGWSYPRPHRDHYVIHSREERVGFSNAPHLKVGKHTQNKRTQPAAFPLISTHSMTQRPITSLTWNWLTEATRMWKATRLAEEIKPVWIVLEAYNNWTVCVCVGMKHWIQYCLRWTLVADVRSGIPNVPLVLRGG